MLILAFAWCFVWVLIGVTSFVSALVATVVILFRAILDAKRLRDLDLPGKFALILAILNVINLQFVALPTLLPLMCLSVFGLYLQLAKGSLGANKYGSPTYSSGLIDALFGTTHHVSPAQDVQSRTFAQPANTANQATQAEILIAIVVTVALSVASIVGIWAYNNHQDANWACLQRIEYYSGSNSYHLEGAKITSFKTKEEALDYCLAERSLGYVPTPKEPPVALAAPTITGHMSAYDWMVAEKQAKTDQEERTNGSKI